LLDIEGRPAMMQSYKFLIARAEQAATEAKDARLENVRQRAKRSEAAWREMAKRALKTNRAREKARLERERVADVVFPTVQSITDETTP
jgi:hypothetical protein